MTKKIILFTCLLGLVFLTAFAQYPSLGTKTLYKPLQSTYTAVPAGYQVAYINYVGRHGARHLTKDVAKSLAWRLLMKADSANALLSAGKELKKAVSNLQKVEIEHLESISVTGEIELQHIAERLFNNQKYIFGTDTKLLVATTKKGRTKESAEAFLSGLKKADPNPIQQVDFNYADDDNLRFYDFSTTYDEFKEKGSWLVPYNKLIKASQIDALAATFTSKFFTPKFIKTLNNFDQATFTDDVYGFYSIIPAVGHEIRSLGFREQEVDFKRFFSATDLVKLGKINNAEDYLKKGPGTNNNGIQVRIAAPLLVDFMKSADAFITSRPYTANLRFSHAETIAPFAALLNLKGASTATQNIISFDQLWKADQVIPFSANIQWILYKHKTTGQYLVKFLLNERETAVNGLVTKTYPYYSWKAVRNFYMEKLQHLGLSLKDDMHNYLLQVK